MQLQEIPDRPAGRRAPVNGIEMYYEIFGEGEPLLFIHGGSASIESWSCQIPAFMGRYRVIAADSRGHGRTADSEVPLDFSLLASDYAGLLDHLGISSVAVVGWSDGGMIGLELAMKRPGLVNKLVAIGSNFRVDGLTDEVRGYFASVEPDDFLPILADTYKALSPDGPGHWPVILGKLKNMWLTQPDYPESELRKVACPVLVMAGDHDIVKPLHSVDLFQALPLGQLCVIPGATHYLPVEKPELVNRIIGDFLESSTSAET